MKIIRRKTRTVKIGSVKIGFSYPVAIQSMVKAEAKNVEASVAQIKSLEAAGCEIVRIAVQDHDDARAIKQIKRRIRLPLVADIHFDHRLALAAIESGIDKVRLNPGNIYKPSQVSDVISAAKANHIPIRIGANSGSLRIKAKDTSSALVKSVIEYLRIFEKKHFGDIVISLKGADILDTISAYQKMSKECDYPLHVGVTATGLPMDGIVKSSAGIGVLLFGGIGDTIRVSLLEKPEQEVYVAQMLLNSLRLRTFGPELICCPTCGRCQVDLLNKAKGFNERLSQLSARQKARLNSYKIALMGCVVNGPGEARCATLGIAFSKHKGVVFKNGEIIRTVEPNEGEDVLLTMIKKDVGGD